MGSRGGAAKRGQARLPPALDEVACGGKPAIEEERGDHRLAHIGKDAGVVAHAGRILVRARRLIRGPSPSAHRHLGQRLAPHQMGVAPREFAFRLVGKAAPQQFCDDQPQDPVAQEFQSFVAAPRAAAPPHRAAMRQRLGEQVRAREFVVEEIIERRRRNSNVVHQWIAINSRS